MRQKTQLFFPFFSSNQSNSVHKSNHSTPDSVKNDQILIPSEDVLATSMVEIIDKHGNLNACRVMLELGSQPYVITSKFVDEIGLDKTTVNITFQGVMISRQI